jgi:hypothetical protein
MLPQQHPDSASAKTAHTVRIARGSIYLDRELCDLYLPEIQSVAVICRDRRVLLLPLHGNAPGGSLLKMRNARGDRVVHALEFLRSLGIEADAPERNVPVRWASDLAGLLLEGMLAETQ